MQEPRQLYGIGGLLKKAARGIKKVVKSPIGKAAILGGLGWGLGGAKMLGGQGIFAGGQGLSRFANLRNIPGLFGSSGKFGNLLFSGEGAKRALSGKKLFGLGAAGLIAAPFIQKAMGFGPYQDEEEEEQVDWSVTPSSIANIRNMAREQDPSLAFLPSSNYAQSGWYGADGGRAGLLNGGEAGEAQMEQMLRAEYMKYRNKGGTMPYEQFKILVMKQSQQGQMPNQMMAADGGRAGYLLGGEIEQETDFIEGPQGNEEFSETVVEDVGPTEEQTAMVIDMIQKGMDASTISSITGLSEAEILTIAEAREGSANGGRMGYAGGQLVTPSADGSRPGYRGLRMKEDFRLPPPDKTDILFQTGPAKENMFENWTEEDWKKVKEKGGIFDILIDILKTPYIIRGGESDDWFGNSVGNKDGGRIGAMGGGLMHLGRRRGYENGEMVEQETDFIQGPGGTEEFDETLMASDPGAGDDMNQVMEFFSLKLYGKSVDQLSEDEYLNLQESLPDLISQMSEGGDTQFAAQGGRIGYEGGGNVFELLQKELEGTITLEELELLEQLIKERGEDSLPFAHGGRIGAQEGGLMDLGGQEKDYRDEGGFVALGGEERADDVPARLSKNEFVFTADAVRNAGGGDIDRGSEVMQNVMDNLEQGGEVSEDSQGLEGGEEIMSEEVIDESNPAQGMYDNYEQLQSRVA